VGHTLCFGPTDQIKMSSATVQKGCLRSFDRLFQTWGPTAQKARDRKS